MTDTKKVILVPVRIMCDASTKITLLLSSDTLQYKMQQETFSDTIFTGYKFLNAEAFGSCCQHSKHLARALGDGQV